MLFFGELGDKYQSQIKFDISFKIPGEEIKQKDGKPKKKYSNYIKKVN